MTIHIEYDGKLYRYQFYISGKNFYCESVKWNQWDEKISGWTDVLSSLKRRYSTFFIEQEENED